MDLRPGPTPERVTWSPEFGDELSELRLAAWCFPPPPERAVEASKDGHDRDAEHWAVRADGTLVAAARVTQHTDIASAPDAAMFEDCSVTPRGRFFVFSRLVVHPSVRHRGLAHSLDLSRLASVASRGGGDVLIIGRRRRWHALLALGFRLVGAVPAELISDWRDPAEPRRVLHMFVAPGASRWE